MAKTQTSIGVNVGNGPALSTFEHTSGRHRQTAIIGDAEDESLLVELPSHDAPDRGSPLKIGGKTRAVPFTGLTNNDRTDAWFTLGGSLGVVNTIEPATIYDGARRAIINFQSSQTFNTPITLISGTASQRIKVLGVHVVCSNLVAAGTFSLIDTSGPTLIVVERFTAIGSRTIGFAGQMVTQTAASSGLQMGFDGASPSTFHISLAYYKAP